MKVGTDAVLLACCIPSDQTGELLDIGSGSGLISLILAQNNPEALITAVEVDKAAFLQSISNYRNSNWSNKIKPVHSSIQDFTKSMQQAFDGIVCNPPFFKSNADLSGSRKTARHDEHLSFHDLILSVAKLLSTNGEFFCIIPYDRVEELKQLALKYDLFLDSEIAIKGKASLRAKRSILTFSKTKVDIIKRKEIIIYNEDNSHTNVYKEITKDFYLKF